MDLWKEQKQFIFRIHEACKSLSNDLMALKLSGATLLCSRMPSLQPAIYDLYNATVQCYRICNNLHPAISVFPSHEIEYIEDNPYPNKNNC